MITKNQKGFTLIESLIYVAFFAIVIGGGMVAVYGIIESTSAGENHIVLQEEANFLFRKMDWALTGATAFSTPGATLVISKSPTQLTFALADGALMLQRDLLAPVALNSRNVKVSAVSFLKTVAAGKPPAITIHFTLATNQNGRPASQDFSFTNYLRK